jgi:hypothetical protein
MKQTAQIILALTVSSFCFGASADKLTPISDTGIGDKEALAKILPTRAPYSPYAGRNYPTRPLFGDTHLHTSYSMDAGAAGARLGPVDALRFGKGEEVVSASGQPVKLSRPLDFLVVADHSDGFGIFPRLLAGDPAFLADPTMRKWYDMMNSGKGMEVALEIVQAQSSGSLPKVLIPVSPATARPGTR